MNGEPSPPLSSPPYCWLLPAAPTLARPSTPSRSAAISNAASATACLVSPTPTKRQIQRHRCGRVAPSPPRYSAIPPKSSSPADRQERLTALQSGEIDVLSRNTTWTSSRDSAQGLNFTG